MKAPRVSLIRLVTVVNLACLACVAATGCQTVTQVAEKPQAASEAPIVMTAQQSIPSATQVTLLYARQLEQQEKLLEAATIYEQLLAEQGDNPVAWHRLAVVQSKIGNVDKADGYFHKAISLDHENAELLCDFGFNCFLQNRLIDAENNYLTALSMNSDIKRLHNNLAVLYARTNRTHYAFEHFRAAGCDSLTARQNLTAVLRGPDLLISPPAPTYDSPAIWSSDPYDSPMPIDDFSPAISAPLHHDGIPMTMSERAAVGQVAFWKSLDDARPREPVEDVYPYAEASSRRQPMYEAIQGRY